MAKSPANNAAQRVRKKVRKNVSDGIAHVHASAECHAFASHLFDAAVDQPLLHLEIRNAIAQQPADPIVLLEHGDAVSRTRELLRARHARRA